MFSTRVPSALATILTLLLMPSSSWSDSHEAGEKAKEQAAEPASKKTPRIEWNQEQMTELSAKLSRSMRDLRRAFRREPSFRDQNSPNRHAVQQLDQTLSQLERSCTQLSARVSGGGGFEQTQGIARRIGTLLNDTDMWSRRVRSTTGVMEAAAVSMKLFNEIAPFYGVAPPFDLERLERKDRPPNPDRPSPAQ